MVRWLPLEGFGVFHDLILYLGALTNTSYLRVCLGLDVACVQVLLSRYLLTRFVDLLGPQHPPPVVLGAPVPLGLHPLFLAWETDAAICRDRLVEIALTATP